MSPGAILAVLLKRLGATEVVIALLPTMQMAFTGITQLPATARTRRLRRKVPISTVLFGIAPLGWVGMGVAAGTLGPDRPELAVVGVLVCGALLGGRAEPPTLVDVLLVVPGCGLYLVCAAMRLARFNLLTDAYGPDYFFGFATTLCGAIVPLYYLIVTRHLTDALWIAVMPGLLALLGLAMVSNLPLPKVKRRKARWLDIFQIVNVAVVYACGFARLWPEYLGFLILLYLGVGGTWCQIKGIRPPARGSAS